MRTGSPVSSIVGNVASSSSKNTAPLEAGQVHAEAEVLGDAERQVRVRRAADVELLRIVEHVFVAVRGRVDHHDLVARRDRRVAELGVGGRRAPEVVQRVLVAQDLLDRARHERGIGPQVGELVGMVEQRAQADDEHRLRRVVAGGDELHEEAAEIDVGHVVAVELGLEQQRREVLARRLLAAPTAANWIAYIAMSIAPGATSAA